MKTVSVAPLLVVISLLAPEQKLGAASASCESLASLVLRGATITSAGEVPPGTFKAPSAPAGGRGNPAAAQAYAALPSFCRVAATLKPTNDSDIKIEVWLPAFAPGATAGKPASGWNGKFQAVGNGGWAGTISYPAMAAAVARGYATASTDTGHSTPGASFALGHPEKLIDYAHRAVHEMTVQAKLITNAYYDRAPSLSIWNGCSTGGRQGITEASKYPADFDAIVAGAAPDPSARLHAVRMAMNLSANRSAESAIPSEKYPLIHNAMLEACDRIDGLKDGVLENPTRCRFDPKTLECKGADRPSCLTTAQVETAKLLYGEVKHPTTGRTLYPPLLLPGSELGWATLAGREPYGNVVEGFKFVVFKDPAWDWRRFNPATDIDLMDKVGAELNSASPNLKPFFDRGGKLLMYHGWSDPQVPAMSSVTYYERVLDTVGKGAAGKSIQLYMVPGMNHCQGGVGTDTFDKVAAIEGWVASGSAPKTIPASHLTAGKVDRTRPLCPYPEVARYSGTGSTDEASSFTCAR